MDLKQDDGFSTTWWSVLLIDKCCQVTSLSIKSTDHHVLLKASCCLRSLFLHERFSSRHPEILLRGLDNADDASLTKYLWENLQKSSTGIKSCIDRFIAEQ